MSLVSCCSLLTALAGFLIQSAEGRDGILSCHIEYAVGFRSTSDVIETLSVPSAQKCSYMCLEIDECNGFNYNPSNYFCELLGSKKPEKVIPAKKWKFYWVRNKNLGHDGAEDAAASPSATGNLGHLKLNPPPLFQNQAKNPNQIAKQTIFLKPPSR